MYGGRGCRADLEGWRKAPTFVGHQAFFAACHLQWGQCQLMGSREFWIRILALTVISWWRKTSPDVLSPPPFKKQIFGLNQYFSYIFKVCVLGFSRETEPVWYIGDLLGEIDSCDYGGWEVPPSVICKPEGSQGSQRCHASPSPKAWEPPGFTQSRAGEDWRYPSPAAGQEGDKSSLPLPFVLFGYLVDWMVPTHIEEDSLLHCIHWFECWFHPEIPHRHTQKSCLNLDALWHSHVDT